jgi:uncharacterized membrane protein YkvA (DUF1232 family)
MRIMMQWKEAAGKLQQEMRAIYMACRDPRTPWYARFLAACVVGYALSPIDLIPDFIPVWGYVDDLLLLPLGIAAVRKMIPQTVLEECRIRAKGAFEQNRPKNWMAAAVIIAIWVVLAVSAAVWIRAYFF